jgi:AraC-like DNA-binding protein
MGNKIIIKIEELNPNVRRAGNQNRTAWKNVERKIYDHEFLYCTSGKAYINIEDRKHEITPGVLVLVKPNKAHSLWMDEQNPADILWAHFDFIYRNDVCGLNDLVVAKYKVLFNEELPSRQFIRPEIIFENGLEFPERLKVDQKDTFESIFKKIVRCFENGDPFWQLECKTLVLQALKIIIKQISNNGSFRSQVKNENVVETIKKYILENYFRKISLSEIAANVGLCEDYCGKIFKKETGENIVIFINRVRLWYAAELMVNSDLSITNIAEMTGFSDSFYFSRVVKKYEGVSPSEWRQRLKACNLL